MSRPALFAVAATIAAFYLFLQVDPAFADRRVALVIGNSEYEHVPVLGNPANDASDVADELGRLGFSVTKLLNANFGEFRKAIKSFNAQVEDAEIGLIYYAGHGMELGGENWLIPIDAEVKTELDLSNEAVSLKTIMQSVGHASELGLVILDACRDNPFAAKMLRAKLTRSVGRGLARVEPASNVLVAYAAKDGTTALDGDGARNSPYTAALLKNLRIRGLEVGKLFRNVRDDVMAATSRRQQPFEYGALSKKAIYFNPPDSLPSTGAPVVAKPADEIVWLAIRESNDAELFESFLSKYPGSPHESDARFQLEGLHIARECDRLMASLVATDRPRGVGMPETPGSVDLDAAARACDMAMHRFPAVGRFAFQAGEIAEARSNYAEARVLYERAGAVGTTPAMFRLGELYETGRGVERNVGEARRWYQKAAAEGHQEAARKLANLDERGVDAPRNVPNARKSHHRRAAGRRK